jgi:hypothetical protein
VRKIICEEIVEWLLYYILVLLLGLKLIFWCFHADKFPSSTDFSVTGGAYDFSKATTSLTNELISSSKKVTLLRHGLSTWNAESRIQVCSLLFRLLAQSWSWGGFLAFFANTCL